MKNHRSLTKRLVNGAVAGAAATWMMNRVTTYLYERGSKAVQLRENRARHGKTTYEVAAEKAARLGGRVLTRAERKKYGSALHWALGAGAGALYGMLRTRLPISIARGLGFGAAFWLLMDEGVVYALRLAPGPRKFPWQTHARGLAGHLSFSAATDAALRILEPVT